MPVSHLNYLLDLNFILIIKCHPLNAPVSNVVFSISTSDNISEAETSIVKGKGLQLCKILSASF